MKFLRYISKPRVALLDIVIVITWVNNMSYDWSVSAIAFIALLASGMLSDYMAGGLTND